MSDSPPKRRTQQERKTDSERAIILATLNLFAKQGYMGTLRGVVQHYLADPRALHLKTVMKNMQNNMVSGLQ